MDIEAIRAKVTETNHLIDKVMAEKPDHRRGWRSFISKLLFPSREEKVFPPIGPLWSRLDITIRFVELLNSSNPDEREVLAQLNLLTLNVAIEAAGYQDREIASKARDLRVLYEMEYSKKKKR